MVEPVTIGVDIGGTKIALGTANAVGELQHFETFSTAADSPQLLEEQLVEALKPLIAQCEVAGIGVAVAGFIDAGTDTVRFAPNLAWRDVDLGQRLSTQLGLAVHVDNDANAAAWAEHQFGAARGHSSVVMVTLGTGIGGGIIVDGELNRGGVGMAGEIGHMRVVPQGRNCPCGLRGCWEAYGSGNALVQNALEAGFRPPAGPRRSLDGHAVATAAAAGDPHALAAFAELDRVNGEALASLCAILDPTCVVIGGGVAESPLVQLERIKSAFEAHFVGRAHRPLPQIVRARLGNQAGMIGAADLARRRALR